MSDLKNQLDHLSVAEKCDLLDAVWQSLEAKEPPVTAAQRDELDHRLAQYRRSPGEVIPWEQVKAGLFKNRGDHL